jgi:hypothetical protein
MIKTISAILILFSSAASIYYSVISVMKPENTLVYNKANVSHLGIQLLSVFLGIGGMLLLFPETFKLGGAFLIAHSLITIICFIIIKDWKGGFLEFLFLQIPIFLLWAGYPLSVLEKFRNLFN